MFRELRLSLVAMGLLMLGGSLGYVLIEGWGWLDAAFMTAITVTTIGFGETHPLSPAGRVFTMALIAVSFGIVGYAAAQTTRYVVEGGFARDLAERRLRRAMDALNDHFIVVGFGRLGKEVAQDLHAQGQRVVVIDTDASLLRDAGAYLAIHGDGSSDAVLLEAAIDRAKGLAVATPNSAINVFVTLSARQLNPDLYIATRIDDREAALKAVRAGANAIVSPFASGGSRMAHQLLHPTAAQFLEQVLSRSHPEVGVDDVPIAVGSQIRGQIKDLKLRERFGVMVVAVRRSSGELVAVPPPETRVGEGDIVAAVGDYKSLAAFKRAAEGPPRKPA